jgi:hypothetical protein
MKRTIFDFLVLNNKNPYKPYIRHKNKYSKEQIEFIKKYYPYFSKNRKGKRLLFFLNLQKKLTLAKLSDIYRYHRNKKNP